MFDNFSKTNFNLRGKTPQPTTTPMIRTYFNLKNNKKIPNQIPTISKKNSYIEKKNQNLLKDSTMNIKSQININQSTNIKYHNDEVKLGEIQIKKLDGWEKEVLFQDYINNPYLKESKNGLDSINWKNNVKDSLSKLQTWGNDYLEKFYKSGYHEQGSIFLQNLNIGRKKFNFEYFMNDDTKSNQINNEFFTNEEDLFNEYEKLKMDTNYDNLAKTEFYRNIIKEKLVLEGNYSEEINKIARNIYEKKIFREKVRNDLYDIINYIKEQENQFNDNKTRLRDSKIHFEKILDKLNFKFSNKLIDILTYETSKPDILNQIDKIHIQLQENDLNFKKINEKYADKIQEKKYKLEAIKNELKGLKFTINYLVKDQKHYYLDILKKGIDVRNEGLSWIVRKLIELDTHLEYSMFPKYLDHAQIDYIIDISYKMFEVNQLKGILIILKDKQKFKNVITNENMFNTKNTMNKKSIMSHVNDFKTTSNVSTSFKKTVYNIFDSITKKENYSKNNYGQLVEDIKINKIIKEFKNYLKMHKDGDKEVNIGNFKNNLINSINDHMNGYYNQIIEIRNHLNLLIKEIQIMKESAFKAYKRKLVFISEEQNMKNDILYSALFGNNIIL